MTRSEAIAALTVLVEEEKSRLVRLWAKGLSAELREIEVARKDLKDPLERHVRELARLLRDRGEEALRLWPETVRPHGAERYDQHFDLEDLAREFKVFQSLLLRLYQRRNGEVPLELAEVVAELTGEALAAAGASFCRVLRSEDVRFREAGTMESILHHVDVGILLAEVDGNIAYVTPPVSRLLGVPVRALMGTREGGGLAALLSNVRARHPNGAPFRQAELPYVRALKERAPVRAVRMVVERPSDGQEVTLEMNATPAWDDAGGGGLWGVIQTFTDRTEAASKSKELVEAYDEVRKLQGRLLQRTRTEALGQLASGAAHALNNFLNVLRLRITLLRKEFRPTHLDALDRTVHEIGHLVARLQDFAVERGAEQLEPAELDQVAREALQLVHGELSRAEPKVVLELDLRAPVLVRIDVGMLRELLVNLALAARERMPDGGRLWLRTAVEDGEAVLRLVDSGKCFSSEELGRLFDPFKGSNVPQLSLLLAVARDHVRRWGGQMRCDNDPSGCGMVCQLRLPVARRDEKAEPPPPALRAVPATGQRARSVLVVDDEPENARMMAEVLGEEGYDVRVAHSGEAALKLWDARRFDAALLDALMPDLSGWDLARRLREKSPHALLAMVTGMDVRGQNRANLAQVDAVFRKPIDVAALDEFLSQSSAPAEPREPVSPPPAR